MKKLNKINIFSEKALGNNELISLKGGTEEGGACTCFCFNAYGGQYGYLLSPNCMCTTDCREAFGEFALGSIVP
jgi:hypothetical protein